MKDWKEVVAEAHAIRGPEQPVTGNPDRDPALRKAALDAVCAWASWIAVETGEGATLELQAETYHDWLTAMDALREELAK